MFEEVTTRNVALRHTWTISNFKSCNEKLLSSKFLTGSNTDLSEWYLIMLPRGKGNQGFVSLRLKLDNCKARKIQANVTLGFLNAWGREDVIFTKFQKFSVKQLLGSHKFLHRSFLFDERNNLLVDDKVTVFCDIVMEVKEDTLTKLSQRIEGDLVKDMAFLLENEEFSDVTLFAGGKEFKAHKLILAARSPVFKAMFEHNMSESRNNRVEITDIDEKVLREMLRFMYSGTINHLEEMAFHLLSVGDKYAINSLKVTCEKALMNALSIDNAVDIFVLSETFHATELKAEAKTFIAAHLLDVGKTPGFHSMVRTHPDLVIEAFSAIPKSTDDANPDCL